MMIMPTKPPDEIDPSNGWEAVAKEFIEGRQQSSVGVTTVQAWAQSLPAGASILDLGCGFGVPISQVLVIGGSSVYGVDASPSLVAAFRNRFPNAHVACEAVEESPFFGRKFDGAVAWGLMFLLPAETQRNFTHRVAEALNSGGRFLFTAPAQACTRADLSTGRASLSLGAGTYKAVLVDSGLTMVGEYIDEEQNHYYESIKA
jgi:cyclopropane fatty-acyl-phospholipid synthase-like methyltransferase